MRLSIISFTENGIGLSERTANVMDEMECTLFTKCSAYAGNEKVGRISYVSKSIGAWTKEQMAKGNALLFIGACGIAVRAIAPYITDKLQDVPVLVMDELGKHVIPILSGHMGGANELAITIAEKTGAEPVITTATDINQKFAVDLFAKKQGLFIVNKEGIAKVSAKVLAGETITMSVETGHCVENDGEQPKVHIGKDFVTRDAEGKTQLSVERIAPSDEQLWEDIDMADKWRRDGISTVAYPPREPVDVVISSEQREFDAALLLRPKEYVIGIGCRKGKAPDQIEEFIRNNLNCAGISTEQIMELASIDVKSNEPALLAWSRKEQIPFVTYSAEELRRVEGAFHTSDFVKDTVGVDNVCERAALRGCGSMGKLVYEKHAEDGMTIAIAKREWRINFEET